MVKLFIVATYQAENDASLEHAIVSNYPDRHYPIGRGQWMIAAKETATEVARTLGILPDRSPFGGSYVVCVDEYFGRTRGEMGDWMDAKAPRAQIAECIQVLENAGHLGLVQQAVGL